MKVDSEAVRFVLMVSICLDFKCVLTRVGGALQEKADLWNTTENHSKSYITLYRY